MAIGVDKSITEHIPLRDDSDRVFTSRNPESDICIVMYGGGLTSFESARRSILTYGKENTEIWFADTRTEDRDLYRFNRDVERALGKEIMVFDQGVDIWGVFFQQRALGNSRIDPCSKFLKRKPLREELDRRFHQWKCSTCHTHIPENPTKIKVTGESGRPITKVACPICAKGDPGYASLIGEYEALSRGNELDSERAREVFRSLDDRLEPADEDGRTVRVVLGMDKIDDCSRAARAELSFMPYRVWFPLDDGVPAFKERIAESLLSVGVRPPRLYDMGFKHNNCGGFCVKAGLGQIAHFYKTKPDEFLEHERREQEFRETINPNVSIFSRNVEGRKQPMTMRALRERIEAGEEFKFDASPSFECQCFSPGEAYS